MASSTLDRLLHDARTAFSAGQHERALLLAKKLLSTEPSHTTALSIVANAAMRLERLDDAEAALSTLQTLAPGDAAIARSLSRVLNRLGHLSAQHENIAGAVMYWRQALTLWPDNDDAAFNLLLHQCSDLDNDATLALLTRLLAQSPEDPAIRMLLAESERDRGAPERAAQHLRFIEDAKLQQGDARALALTVGDIPLIERSLPIDLPVDKQTEATQAAYACIRTVQDDNAALRLTQLIQRRHRIGQEAPTLRMALAEHLSLPSVHASVESIRHARARFDSGLTALAEEFTPKRLGQCAPSLAQLTWSNFLLAYHCEDDLALQSCYGDWLCMAAATLRPDLAIPSERRKPGPPRIGLLSGHWHESTAGSYFASWIEALDAPEFDTRIYALGPRFDALTEALERSCRNFVRLEGNVDEAARIVRDADLDLLIYPELGMDMRLMPMAALRLARQQWVAWGHPVTTGLPSIDAFLSCADMEPVDAAAHYRERLLLLPGLGTRYRAPDAPPRHSRAELGLPPGKLVVVPQSSFKIHPDNDHILRELLTLASDAKVMMFTALSRLDGYLLKKRLHQRLGPLLFKRLFFHPMVSRAHFLKILASCDLMLDTLHWSGGNTSLDALRAGIPIVTTPTRFMRGRQSSAMLGTLAMHEAIVDSPDQLAVRAAQMLQRPPDSPSVSQLSEFLNDERPLAALRNLVRQAL